VNSRIFCSGAAVPGRPLQATERKRRTDGGNEESAGRGAKNDQEKAAGRRRSFGGERNDKGKWNYEVVVKTKGKEWGFEVEKAESIWANKTRPPSTRKRREY